MIDRNFTMITHTNRDDTKEVMSLLKYRFLKVHNKSPKEYIDKHDFDKSTFSKLLNRRITGTKVKDKTGKQAMIIKQLKKDCIWSGILPWEVKDE